MERTTETDTRHADRARDTRARVLAARQVISPTEGYRTPDWLERSFVLPVVDDGSELPEMPVQPVRGHDDLDVTAHTFVRPATPEVDFAAVVHRCDASRRARQAALLLLVLAVVAGLAALVVAPVLALAALVLAAGGVAAAVWSVGQTRAPVPLRG